MEMTKKEFVAEVITAVEEFLPNCEIEAKEVQKNNGVLLQGLIIKNGRCNISPTIYLDYYYGRYVEGTDFDSLVSQIMKKYQEYKSDKNFDISVFTDFEKAKENLCYKLVNYEQNKELLADVPYFKYLDLAIVFYCLLDLEKEQGSILVKNAHMNYWGVTNEQLLKVAKQNTSKILGYQIITLADIVREVLKRNCPEMEEEEIEEIVDSRGEAMYVLTNKKKLYGATCILYKDILKQISERFSKDLYIIPSSVHETLLIPAEEDMDIDYLSEMVKSVNATEVEPEEVLADHVYFYNRENNMVFCDVA